ncbi:radical SAM family heme chaperone HemW [Thermovenabulum gondwanense]|uniref:Heme chaperone HemW n=1 Tax=Thermovenabulum gondwanense TaxID=520767 RepID=A0A161PTJ6_9FIRM|nr:radical SAM family heme chaperone HemW [Thermovenabulum gondwanense]KYO65155.1 Oxygen-independent coproporphyrinogen-III oxidase-like protein YqeR [Thermovenabulum gondwanense]
MLLKDISVYIHIPFCIKKCFYCDFNSYSNFDLVDDYLNALFYEIERYKDLKRPVKTLYIGGGTPTVLNEKKLYLLINTLYKNFSINNEVEFTVEANPETLTKNKIKVLKKMGVNRLSIGLQAYDDKLLKVLGRIHDVKRFEKAYFEARETGFENINVDIIFGIPGQTKDKFEKELKKLIKLEPSHISCYSLTLEEGTVLHLMMQKGLLELPDEDEERYMYHTAKELLENEGYIHYEISNFAKPGKECVHNITYWKCEEYLGFGAGAHSFIGNLRFSNYKGIKEYIESIFNKNLRRYEEIYVLSQKDKMQEFVFMGLRRVEGISKNEFKNRFCKQINDIYGSKILELKEKGLIYEDEEKIKLTLKGLDLANLVFMEFID